MTEFLNCPDHEDLAAWIDGQVEAPTRARLEAHVVDCDRCAAVVEEVLAFNEELGLAEDGVDDSFFDPEPVDPPFAERQPSTAARVRWQPYFAAALLILVATVSFWQIQQATGANLLRQDLQGLWENDLIHRGPLEGLSEEAVPVAKRCHKFLKNAGTSDPVDILKDCLDLVARNPELASQVVSEAPGFPSWLRSDDELLATSSCRVLKEGWLNLRGTRQDELRLSYEACLERPELAAP